MADQGSYCPFLNRSDDRCSAHFSLDHLNHAFKHCFGSYKTCPVYMDLLIERRLRRSGGRETMLAELNESSDAKQNAHHARPLVQITIRH